MAGQELDRREVEAQINIILDDDLRRTAILERLRDMEVGRPLVVNDESQMLMGIILPLNPDQTLHTLFLIDGTGLILGAEKGDSALRQYKAFFSPNPFPFLVGVARRDAANLTHYFQVNNGNLHNVVIARNNTPEGKTKFDHAFKDSVRLALELKHQREELIRASSVEAIEFVEQVLKPEE